MTDEYKVVTNKEIIDTAVPILKKHKAELKESISLGSGERSIWKWIIPDIKIEVAKGDVLNPEIIIKNSYDGSLQVHVLAGAFRLVCSNGLIIGVTLGQSTFKHNINNKNLEKLDEAILGLVAAMEGIDIGDIKFSERGFFVQTKNGETLLTPGQEIASGGTMESFQTKDTVYDCLN